MRIQHPIRNQFLDSSQHKHALINPTITLLETRRSSYFHTSRDGTLSTGIKCRQGNVPTQNGGAWSVNYASAELTTVPNVESQAISPSGALSGLLFSTMTAPTATTASGVVALAGIGGLGGPGRGIRQGAPNWPVKR